MPSPFPGMNPYLEQEDVWSDFHNRFIPAAAEAIGLQVVSAYVVKIDQNEFVQEPDEELQVLGRPDVFVTEGLGTRLESSAGVALVSPTRARIVPPVTAEKTTSSKSSIEKTVSLLLPSSCSVHRTKSTAQRAISILQNETSTSIQACISWKSICFAADRECLLRHGQQRTIASSSAERRTCLRSMFGRLACASHCR
jgi:hypothetical protein